MTLNAPAAKPRPAIISATMRAAAFIIDIVIVCFIGFSLATFLRGPLLQLGPLWPFLSMLIVFGYFWLGNGPVGKGATIGKSVLNMHTVNADGSPLGWKKSFWRTFVQWPALMTATFRLFCVGLNLPALVSSHGELLFTINSVTLFCVLVYTVMTHPFRQGWHDLAGGAYVTSDPTPSEFYTLLAQASDPIVIARAKSQRRISVMFCSVIWLIMVVRWGLSLFDAAMREEMYVTDLIAARAPVTGYRLAVVRLPSTAGIESFNRTAAEIISRAPAGEDKPTTETIRKMIPDDGETAIIQFSKLYAETGRTEMDDPKIRGEIERVRQEFIRAYESIPAKNKSRPPAKRILVGFADPFRFAFLPVMDGGIHAWTALGPMDGPLEYQWYQKKSKPSPEPRKSDSAAPTSGTQPAAH
ncbi:RDD family protein [Candidatus Sumerlaeota bacterium]|nr:RDD family protein [Candidatus Sumerlaeota bacterium]